VFLELPRDKVLAVPNHEHHPLTEIHSSDPDALREALEEARESIKAARRPVIIAGIELHRFGLQDQLLKFAEHNNIPICATLLGRPNKGTSEKGTFYIS
jgi:indolepyruvate decarboxylase